MAHSLAPPWHTPSRTAHHLCAPCLSSFGAVAWPQAKLRTLDTLDPSDSLPSTLVTFVTSLPFPLIAHGAGDLRRPPVIHGRRVLGRVLQLFGILLVNGWLANKGGRSSASRVYVHSVVPFPSESPALRASMFIVLYHSLLKDRDVRTYAKKIRSISTPALYGFVVFVCLSFGEIRFFYNY